jgi:hypothetical protein
MDLQDDLEIEKQTVPVYSDPSEAEILRMCEVIQATWTVVEKQRRITCHIPECEVQVVSVAELVG